MNKPLRPLRGRRNSVPARFPPGGSLSAASSPAASSRESASGSSSGATPGSASGSISGSTPTQNDTPDAIAPRPEQPGALRVATYNIHKGVVREFFGLQRIARIHELRARLHELDADLIALQEVLGRHDRYATRFEQWPAEPQDQFLARLPGLKHTFETAYGKNASYLHGHHGNALLSRFPIMRRENRDVSDHVMEKRGILHCVVRVGRRNVHMFVVHFGLFARSRERQAAALIDWVGKSVPARAPLIIAGDFNDWRDALSDRLRGELGVTEVFEQMREKRAVVQRAAYFMHDKLSGLGVNVKRESFRVPRAVRAARTFPALVPWLRMDRIYQRGFEVTWVGVPRGIEWARISDHSPLIADLSLLPSLR